MTSEDDETGLHLEHMAVYQPSSGSARVVGASYTEQRGKFKAQRPKRMRLLVWCADGGGLMHDIQELKRVTARQIVAFTTAAGKRRGTPLHSPPVWHYSERRPSIAVVSPLHTLNTDFCPCITPQFRPPAGPRFAVRTNKDLILVYDGDTCERLYELDLPATYDKGLYGEEDDTTAAPTSGAQEHGSGSDEEEGPPSFTAMWIGGETASPLLVGGASDGRLMIADAGTGEKLKGAKVKGPEACVYELVGYLWEGGVRIVAGSQGRIVIYDLPDRAKGLNPLREHAFDGGQWVGRMEAFLHQAGAEGGPTPHVAFSLAGGGEGMVVHALDCENGVINHTITVPTAPGAECPSMAWRVYTDARAGGGGKAQIVTWTQNEEGGHHARLLVWAFDKPGSPLRTLQHPSAIGFMTTFTDAGGHCRVIAGDKGQVRCWDPETGSLLRRMGERVTTRPRGPDDEPLEDGCEDTGIEVRVWGCEGLSALSMHHHVYEMTAMPMHSLDGYTLTLVTMSCR
jgi:hypothetical protein